MNRKVFIEAGPTDLCMAQSAFRMSCHLALLVVLVIVFAACGAWDGQPRMSAPVADRGARGKVASALASLPCGSLHVRGPLVNVSGAFPVGACPSSRVFLFIAPNVTLDGVLYAVERCAPIGSALLGEDGDFSLGALPAGDYVVAVGWDPVCRSAESPVVYSSGFGRIAFLALSWSGEERLALAVFWVVPGGGGS